MTDARITSATTTQASLVSNGRMPSLLTGAAPDFSGLLQALAQSLTDDTPSAPSAPPETPADRPAACSAEDETEDQPAHRDVVKTARATARMTSALQHDAVAEDAATEEPTTELATPADAHADDLAAKIKSDDQTAPAVAPTEAALPAETKPDDTMLTWLAGQQAVTTPKIAASQKATPAQADSAASAAGAAPMNAAAVVAPTQQGAPAETVIAQNGLAPDATAAPDFKQPALQRVAANPNPVKPEDAAPAPVADISVASAVPPPVKNAEAESTRALAAQAVPESSGSPSPVAPPQGIAPVSVAAPMPMPAAPKPVESARNPEQNFSGLDALGNTRSLNGYQSATNLAATRTSRTSGLQAAAIIEQVAVKLHQQAQSGLDQLTIQLRPADLGRVDVKLQFHDGSVTGTIIADSQATLDLLQKDQRSLERALQESGLRTEPGALSFALRDQSGQGQNLPSNNRGASRALTAEVLLADASDADGETAIITANRVNLRV